MAPPSEVEEAAASTADSQQSEQLPVKVEEEQTPNPNQNQNLPPFLRESITSLQSLNLVLSDFLIHYTSLSQTLSSLSTPQNPNALLDRFQSQSQPQRSKSSELIELESICRSNGAKSLRKYIIAHLPEVDTLRKLIPEALKASPNPGRTVFDGMGKFFIQGSKAYDRPNSKEIDVRRAGVLLLEFFLISGCATEQKLAAAVKEDAREAAVVWRRRMLSEGGIENASEVDALGLVLLVAGFGIPAEFKSKEIWGLLKLSNLKKKGEVLRRSVVLVEKIPDIIKDLITKEMGVEAVNLVCTFGLEEKFPPLPLLSSYVKRACEIGVQERKEAQSSIKLLKQANEKQLAALKSVVKCLEDYKIDATELTSFNITQKIVKLEKDILREEQKLQSMSVVKRRADDVLEPRRRSPGNQAKQLRPSSGGASHIAHSIRQSQVQGIPASSFLDTRYAAAYNGSIADNSFPPPLASLHGTALHGHEDGALYQKNSVGLRIPGNPSPYSSVSGHNSNFTENPATAAASHRTGGSNPYQFTATGLEREYLAKYGSHPTASAVADPHHQPSSYHAESAHQLSYPLYPGYQLPYHNPGH